MLISATNLINTVNDGTQSTQNINRIQITKPNGDIHLPRIFQNDESVQQVTNNHLGSQQADDPAYASYIDDLATQNSYATTLRNKI